MATKDVSAAAPHGHPHVAVGTKGHRRRPSGQPPPLPRDLGASGRFWIAVLVYVGALVVLEVVVYLMAEGLGRPRPFGVTILGPWTGFSMPSRPMAGLAVSLVGILYALIPHGRSRDAGKVAVTVFLAVVIAARMILAVEGPSAAVFGAILGVAIGLVAFRL